MKSRNPFYLLLVVVGTLFAVTAFAYGIMALQDVRASAELVSPDARHPLLTWLRHHGATAMLVELSVLAVLTCAAIGTDDYWEKKPQES